MQYTTHNALTIHYTTYNAIVQYTIYNALAMHNGQHIGNDSTPYKLIKTLMVHISLANVARHIFDKDLMVHDALAMYYKMYNASRER